MTFSASASAQITADLNDLLRQKRDTDCKRRLLAQYQILQEQYGNGMMLANARGNRLPDPEGFTEKEYQRQAGALLAALKACG